MLSGSLLSYSIFSPSLRLKQSFPVPPKSLVFFPPKLSLSSRGKPLEFTIIYYYCHYHWRLCPGCLGTPSVAQVGSEIAATLLSQLHKCWNYRREPQGLVSSLIFRRPLYYCHKLTWLCDGFPFQLSFPTHLFRASVFLLITFFSADLGVFFFIFIVEHVFH